MNELNRENTYNKRNNTSRYAFLLMKTIIIVSALITSPTYAKNCRKVHLEVHNQTGVPIKIIDVDYWDEESEIWRSEPIKNEVINNNRFWQESRTLEHVYNQDVKIRYEYRIQKDRLFGNGKKWSSKKRKYSAVRQCKKYKDYSVTIN